MNEDLNPAPLANGSAEGLGPVPVMETIPVVAKPKRKRKKKAAPKVARAPKEKKLDRLLAEHLASKASATNPPILQSASPNEAATVTSHCVQGAVADHFIEARERRYDLMFTDARSTTAPRIKSSWRERFVFGLRRMTGLDDAVDPEPFALSSTLKALLVAAVCVSGAGVYLAWF